MKRIKNIDYFRKDGEHAKATRTGGIISILSVIVTYFDFHLHVCIQTIVYLAMTQWAIYMKPNVSKDTTVQVDIHKGSEFVDLDIDLVFPKAPCSGKYFLTHIDIY